MSMISKQVGAVAVLAMSALVSMSVQAQTGPDALRIVKDANTGELRAPTMEESKAFEAKRASEEAKGGARRAAKADGPTHHVHHKATGIRGARMSDSTMSEARVLLNADGTLDEFCSDPSHNHGTPSVTKTTKLETE